jgi:hypothetical protein
MDCNNMDNSQWSNTALQKDRQLVTDHKAHCPECREEMDITVTYFCQPRPSRWNEPPNGYEVDYDLKGCKCGFELEDMTEPQRLDFETDLIQHIEGDIEAQREAAAEDRMEEQWERDRYNNLLEE